MALRSYSVLDILLPPIIIITHVNACRACGCVSNMLLVLLITFYCHHNIWDCVPHVIIIIKSEGSTFPIVIIFSVVMCLRCLLNYFLSRIAYTFRENRDFGFIIIVQFMMSADSRMPFGLQIVFVCLSQMVIIGVSVNIRPLTSGSRDSFWLGDYSWDHENDPKLSFLPYGCSIPTQKGNSVTCGNQSLMMSPTKTIIPHSVDDAHIWRHSIKVWLYSWYFKATAVSGRYDWDSEQSQLV